MSSLERFLREGFPSIDLNWVTQWVWSLRGKVGVVVGTRGGLGGAKAY